MRGRYCSYPLAERLRLKDYSVDLALKIVSIVVGGGIGGLANAILADGGFKKGYREILPNGQSIWRPGWVGNVFVGAFAGFIVWVLYGTMNIADVQELLRQVVGSMVAGAGGGRIITGEVDKRILVASKDQLTEALKPKRSK